MDAAGNAANEGAWVKTQGEDEPRRSSGNSNEMRSRGTRATRGTRTSRETRKSTATKASKQAEASDPTKDVGLWHILSLIVAFILFASVFDLLYHADAASLGSLVKTILGVYGIIVLWTKYSGTTHARIRFFSWAVLLVYLADVALMLSLLFTLPSGEWPGCEAAEDRDACSSAIRNWFIAHCVGRTLYGFGAFLVTKKLADAIKLLNLLTARNTVIAE